MKWSRNLILCATLGLSSCGVLDKTIDKGGVVATEVVTQMSKELGDLKTEALKEVKEAIAELRTDTLREVEKTIKEITPQIVEDVMNSDSVAFLIVSVVSLGSIVVLVALFLLLGSARAWWRRLSSRSTE